MKKKLLLTIILLLCISFSAFSQKELWWLTTGYNSDVPGFPSNYGSIHKVGFNGQNESTVHNFDSINGKLPYEYERLFLASDGKLYGTTSRGGFSIPNTSIHDGAGVLFEYDLTLNTYKALTFFGTSPLASSIIPQAGVIESEGILYGTTSGYGSIYKYNTTTGMATFGAQIPSFNIYQNEMKGDLMKASNGMIYGVTKNFSACPQAAPFLGAIARFNPANNSFSIVHPLYCIPTEEGWAPTGGLVEGRPGKLYGTTVLGGQHTTENAPYGSGILFEYDITTNTYTKKVDFNVDTNGYGPGPLTLGANGKLYGLLSGLYDLQAPDNGIMGSLYEYDIASNTMTVLHDFTWPEAGGSMQGTLLKGSDGNLYGKHNYGIFKFNPVTNETVTLFESFRVQDLIEVCRKPSYHFFDIDTFTPCVNTPFIFDVQNTNATGYVWKKDGVILPLQTTGILNLPNVTNADSGNYICEMTNECGITVTMPLHLNVGCLGIDEMAVYKNKISLYPNPVKETLNIKFPASQNFTIKEITISNMLGQTVFNSFKNETAIDAGFLEKGVYILEMTTNKGNWSGKFIKQ